MTLKLLHPGHITGTPFYTGAVEGDVIAMDGTIVAAVPDAVRGLLFGVPIVTDGQQRMMDVYGDGSVFEDSAAPFTANAPVYSDGDGTYSAVQPTSGAAGTLYYIIGYAITTSVFVVSISAMTDLAT